MTRLNGNVDGLAPEIKFGTGRFDGLVCPGVFYPTRSGDGVLSRIRTPGGLVSAEQCALVAEIADRYAAGLVTITNRGNLQLRALADQLPDDVLIRLQRLRLAGGEPAVDHLRNIMASPTAGVDDSAVLDTRPLVLELDRYIASHSHLAPLPAKFSVGLDGGERASIAGLPNDILFRAYRDDRGEARWRVVLRIGAGDGTWTDLGFALISEQVVPVTAALADLYLGMLPADGSKPRLRQLLADVDRETVQQRLRQSMPSLVADGDSRLPPTSSLATAPIGVFAQVDESLTYVGLQPPVAGRLSSMLLRHLTELASRFGSGTIRLSPWRNVVIPDVPRESVDHLQDALDRVGLSGRAPSLASGIVACAGSAGCSSGYADTIRDAQVLSARLSELPAATRPLNIHLTGCEKCCAQRRPADITLLGRPGTGERYDLFVRGEGDVRLGRLLVENLSPDDALTAVMRFAAQAVES
jgi:ferredoxin-nitrite reductase